MEKVALAGVPYQQEKPDWKNHPAISRDKRQICAHTSQVWSRAALWQHTHDVHSAVACCPFNTIMAH